MRALCDSIHTVLTAPPSSVVDDDDDSAVAARPAGAAEASAPQWNGGHILLALLVRASHDADLSILGDEQESHALADEMGAEEYLVLAEHALALLHGSLAKEGGREATIVPYTDLVAVLQDVPGQPRHAFVLQYENGSRGGARLEILITSPLAVDILIKLKTLWKTDVLARTWRVPGPRHAVSSFRAPGEISNGAHRARLPLAITRNARAPPPDRWFTLDSYIFAIPPNYEPNATSQSGVGMPNHARFRQVGEIPGSPKSPRSPRSPRSPARRRDAKFSGAAMAEALGLEDSATAFFDVSIMEVEDMVEIPRSPHPTVRSLAEAFVASKAVLVHEMREFESPHRYGVPLPHPAGRYVKRANYNGDVGRWDCWQIHARTSSAIDPHDEEAALLQLRHICVIALRRSCIPPLMEKYQDIVIVLYGQQDIMLECPVSRGMAGTDRLIPWPYNPHIKRSRDEASVENPMCILERVVDSVSPSECTAPDRTVVQARIDAFAIEQRDFAWFDLSLHMHPVLLPLGEEFVDCVESLIHESVAFVSAVQSGASAVSAFDNAVVTDEGGSGGSESRVESARNPFTYASHLVDCIIAPSFGNERGHAAAALAGMTEKEEEEQTARMSTQMVQQRLEKKRRRKAQIRRQQRLKRGWERRSWRFLSWVIDRHFSGGIEELAALVLDVPQQLPQRKLLERVMNAVIHLRKKNTSYDERSLHVKAMDFTLMDDVCYNEVVMAKLIASGYIKRVMHDNCGGNADIFPYFLRRLGENCISSKRRYAETHEVQLAISGELHNLVKGRAGRSGGPANDTLYAAVHLVLKCSDNRVILPLLSTVHAITKSRTSQHMQSILLSMPGAIQRMVDLVEARDMSVTHAAVCILRNLSRETDTRDAIIKAGAITRLAGMVEGRDLSPHRASLAVLYDAVYALFNMARDKIAGMNLCRVIVRSLGPPAKGKEKRRVKNLRFWKAWAAAEKDSKEEAASDGTGTMPRMIFALAQLLQPGRVERNFPGQFYQYDSADQESQLKLLRVTVDLLITICQNSIQNRRHVGLVMTNTKQRPRRGERRKCIITTLTQRMVYVSRERLTQKGDITKEYFVNAKQVLPVLRLIDELSEDITNCKLLGKCKIKTDIQKLAPVHPDSRVRDRGWFPDDGDESLATKVKNEPNLTLRDHVRTLLASIDRKQAKYEMVASSIEQDVAATHNS